MAKALVATFCLVYSVVMVAEHLALAVIHRFVIHPVEPKWLHLVDPVLALVQAVEPKWLHLADQVADQVAAQLQAVAQRLHRAILAIRAVHLARQSFRISELSFAV